MKYKKLMIFGSLAILSLLSFAIAGQALIAGTMVVEDSFHVIF